MDKDVTLVMQSLLWQMYIFVSIAVMTVAFYKAGTWMSNDWEGHPITKKLENFLNADLPLNSLIHTIDNDYSR